MKFDYCFERHATEDVKAAVEEAGEYHKFIKEERQKLKEEALLSSRPKTGPTPDAWCRELLDNHFSNA